MDTECMDIETTASLTADRDQLRLTIAYVADRKVKGSRNCASVLRDVQECCRAALEGCQVSAPTREDAAVIETLIDRVGLYETVSLIEAICASKADHIRSAWQDEPLARVWERAGRDLCHASAKFAGIEVLS